MLSSEKPLAPVLAPSPPLSDNASPRVGAVVSDCELDTTDAREEEALGHNRRPRRNRLSRRLRHQSKTDSPPSSPTSSFSSNIGQPEGSAGRPQRSDGGDNLQRAFSLIKASWQGLPDDSASREWHVLHIEPSQFLELRNRLQDEDPRLLSYFNETLRFDYTPERATLILRLMATTVHEYLKEYIIDQIKNQLSDYSDPTFRVSQYLSNIKWHGHAKLTLDSGAVADDAPGADSTPILEEKSPDGQSWYGSEKYPQFVMEIGYSQKAANLEELARDYFEGSDGEIKTVLTLDLEYANPEQRKAITTSRTRSRRRSNANRTAVFCLYRGPERVCKDIIFRNPDGSPSNSSVQLELLLSDFIPDKILKKLAPQTRSRINDCTINLTSNMLCTLLKEAEDAQALKDAWQQEQKQARQQEQPTRKRKSVNWASDVGTTAASGGSASAGSNGSDEEAIGSTKRRKAGADEDSMYRSSRSASTVVSSEGVRTRSSSQKAHGKGDSEG